MKTFAVIGAAGFVAPRHMGAIRDVGGHLAAALDPHDSVGVLDSYSRACHFFTDEYRFERYLTRHPVDYVVVCSPNYMHDFHCRLALRCGADVICEKPLCLEVQNLDAIQAVEADTGHRVHPLLQLRVHPQLVALSNRWAPVLAAKPQKFRLDYVTPRGLWYAQSWKGDVLKSGGVITNLGVHLVDALIWIFGEPHTISLEESTNTYASGRFEFTDAVVDWSLSTEPERESLRQLVGPDGAVLADFTKNFTSYHTEVYKRILAGRWIKSEDARSAIRVCAELRRWASSSITEQTLTPPR